MMMVKPEGEFRAILRVGSRAQSRAESTHLKIGLNSLNLTQMTLCLKYVPRCISVLST